MGLSKIFRKHQKRRIRIVCFGGGNAMPKAVLEPLKKYPVKLFSITSMVESGGSSGSLREDLNILPPGDVSRQLVALSDAPKWKKELFLMRFGKEEFPGGHIGHRFGTVFIAGLEYLLKDFKKALKIAHNFLEIKEHQALPATIAHAHVWAILANGKRIKGEDEIDVPKIHNGNLKLKKIYLKPKVRAYPKTLEAVRKAELIIFGPGDLYSSIIPCFLPEGMKEVIQKSKGKKVFICNLMTKYGETNNFTVLDFVKEIERYLDSQVDYVIYNNFIPPQKIIKKYKNKHPELLDLVEVGKNLQKGKFIGRNLLQKNSIEHHPQKLVKFIIQFL